MKFYERKEVKDVLAYLKVIANPSDAVSLRRIINVPQEDRGKDDREDRDVSREKDFLFMRG